MKHNLSADIAVESFDLLWQHSADAWFLVSVGGDDFCYYRANPVFRQFFAPTAEAAEGIPLRQLLDAGEYEMRVTPYRQCLQHGKTQTFEWRCERAGGFSDWQIQLFPLQGHGGRICFLLGHGRDITEQRQTAQQLTKLRSAGQTEQARKTAFIANISHEMRTPVSGLAGAVDLLADCTDGQEREQLLNIVRTSGDHLSQLTQDIFDYVQLSAGSVHLDYQRFSLHDLIDALVGDKTAALNRQGVHLRVLLKALKGVEFYGDASRIHQLLDKLLDNAIKFTHEGEVSVTAEVAIREGNARLVTLRVKDTGCGIDICRLDDVFKPFRQLDESTTRRYGGAGLGLAIAKLLIDRMEGDISVVSQTDQGTEFIVRLPLLMESNQPIFRETLTVDRSVLQGARALVVEDNPINKMVTEQLLKKHGVAVVSAANGREALDQLKADPAVDIILMDWHMPHMDGVEAAREIRALRPPEDKLPIIGLTASIDHQQMSACQAAGMNDVLGKPVASDVLIDRLAHWLSLPAN